MKTMQKRIVAGLLGTVMLINTAGCKEALQKKFGGQVQAATIKEAENREVDYEFYLSHRDFYEKTMKSFLKCGDVGNAVYSPVNVYIAMGMLARCTTGESQQQILDLLGDESIDEVRENVQYLFETLTIDEENCITTLANSIWLSAGEKFHEEVLKELGKEYYTSSFTGDMGSQEFNDMLHDWINDNTNNLLKEQVNEIKFDTDTVFALVSTIYYKVSWENEFDENNTYEQTFYGNGEEYEIDFMHSSAEMSYYVADTFTAISIPTLNGAEWYFLPNEGYTNEDILEDDCLYEVVGGTYDNVEVLDTEVIYSIPKLDAESQLNLISGLMELGVTNVFDSTYGNLFTVIDDPELYVYKVIHGARLINDEKGVEAAGYTVMMTEDIAVPSSPMYFCCDRPYVTVVTEYGVPVFTGTINNPNVTGGLILAK